MKYICILLVLICGCSSVPKVPYGGHRAYVAEFRKVNKKYNLRNCLVCDNGLVYCKNPVLHSDKPLTLVGDDCTRVQ